MHETVTVRKYVLSLTVALAFRHDIPFIPLHYIFVTLASSPHHSSLPFTSLNFTTLSCIFYDVHHSFTSPHFHFPNPFPE
jgi:hypothetical protein